MTEPFTKEMLRSYAGRTLSPDGELAVDGFFSLPGMEAISIAPEYPGEAMTAFDIGLPLGLLLNVESAMPFRRQISADILKPKLPSRRSPVLSIQSSIRRPRDAAWSELQAGAILSRLGARVDFVKRADRHHLRTPDIRTFWPGNVVIDVEVTRPQPRPPASKQTEGVSELAGAVGARGNRHHYLVLMEDGSARKSLEEVLNAITQVQVSESCERSGQWFVIALPLEARDLLHSDAAIKRFAPSWWDKTQESTSAITTAVGGENAPYTRLVSHFPSIDYLSPVRNKADRNQRDPSNALVIAFDTYPPDFLAPDLKQEEIGEQLRALYPGWKNVAGVMLFRYWPSIGYSLREWDLSFYSNSHADIPCPSPGPLPTPKSKLTFNLTVSDD